MNSSEKLDQLAAAMVKFQSVVTGALKVKENSFYKTSSGKAHKYATLESVWDAIKEPLTHNGLSVIQSSETTPEGPALVTILLHTSGQYICGKFPLVCKDPNDPQKLGSSTTYARRYALAAMLGITQEDDDGNKGAGLEDAQPTTKTLEDLQETVLPFGKEHQKGKKFKELGEATVEGAINWAKSVNKYQDIVEVGEAYLKLKKRMSL